MKKRKGDVEEVDKDPAEEVVEKVISDLIDVWSLNCVSFLSF